MLRPSTRHDSLARVAWSIVRASDGLAYDAAKAGFGPAESATLYDLTPGLRPFSTRHSAIVECPKGIADGVHEYHFHDPATGVVFDWYAVRLVKGDDLPVATPAPVVPPARTTLMLAAAPGLTLRYSIERLANGAFYDFKARGFPANPSEFLAPLAQSESGPTRGVYRANLPATPAGQASPFPDGLYAIHVHEGAGGWTVAVQTFPAFAVGGLLRIA